MKQLRVALVHDYLGEFGGAERVLLALSEMFPQAPIYTAFFRKGEAYERFKHRDIRVSWAHHIPFFATKLHSPLRFLAPLIWESFDFKGYDLVISSASWYITKGILTGPETTHISYIHTPPRYLYGFETSVNWQKYWLLRAYARVVNHFLREYDFAAAQRPDILIANSENTRRRIQKFYRRDATVVYPPVSLEGCDPPKAKGSHPLDKEYFLIVSRVVGGKGLELAVKACTELGLPLKVVGEQAGWSGEMKRLKRLAGYRIEFLGSVSDNELVNLYSGAKAFLATARDEDFGMTIVEAQLCGTPVIAYRGGGYLETVVDGMTGLFFDDYSIKGLKEALGKFKVPCPQRLRRTCPHCLRQSHCRRGRCRRESSKFKVVEIQNNAKRFSKQKFAREMKKVIDKV